MTSFALTNFQKVRYFNIVFGSPRSEFKDFSVFTDHPQRVKLRWDLIDEESKELKEAIRTHDYVEILDAISDILYVVLGAFDAFGYNPDHDLGWSGIERLILKFKIDLIPELDAHFSRDRMALVLESENTTIRELFTEINKSYSDELSKLHRYMFENKYNSPKNNYNLVIAQLMTIHEYLYLWAYLFGFNLDQTFALVHESNMSKLATTEEIAIETVEWYKKNKVEYDSPAYRLSEVKDNGEDRWVIYNQSSGKALKSIKYHAVDLKTYLEKASSIPGKSK